MTALDNFSANTTMKTVLIQYPKAITHLRRQLDDGRLGLIFGAGVSKPYGFPDWAELVERIAVDPAVDAGNVITSGADMLPLPILTEVLYQRYRQRHYEEFSQKISSNMGDLDRLLLAGWRRVIHDALYKGISDDPSSLLKIESAYRHFLAVVKKTPITITYNFDDTLERLLLHTRSPEEREITQTFQTVVDPRLPYRQGSTVIFHVNGFLPSSLLESTSDMLVFNEGTFADQLIDVMAGQYSSLLHHLTKSTCLLVGLSLNDETLRHLLRQSARLSPGNYHYFVRYVKPGAHISDDHRRAESISNFETYNLITLYLNDVEMQALGDLLTEPREDLTYRADDLGVRLCYSYYLVGVPGVGKTTTFGHFNNLVTHDEWLEPRHPLLGKPFDSLTSEQEADVDSWILHQVGLKNRKMIASSNGNPVGIHLIDRCPLDAITFTQAAGWADKAQQLLDVICPGQATRKTYDGQLILMKGDPAEIRIRAATREKEVTVGYTRRLNEALEKLYCGQGTVVLDVERMSVQDVVKAVARIIFFNDTYKERGLHQLLLDVKHGIVTAPEEAREG